MLLKSVNWLVYDVLVLGRLGKFADVVSFFIYDSIKIFLLLFFFVAFIGFLRTFISQKNIDKYLKSKGAAAYFFASFFGAITPFCSCSSIPLFIGFIKAGVPLGVTFAFLITSPLVNEYLVVLMAGFFGLKITALYVLNGMILGIAAGFFIDRLKMERFILADMKGISSVDADFVFKSFKDRLKFGLNESTEIVKKIWLWLVFSILLGALIHNYVPDSLVHDIISRAGAFSVPLAVVMGVPLYGSCAAIMPIAFVLFQKGIPLGTTLSFMMAISALSLPEAIMLRRVMKLELIAVFFGITTLGLIIVGYLFNYVQILLK